MHSDHNHRESRKAEKGGEKPQHFAWLWFVQLIPIYTICLQSLSQVLLSGKPMEDTPLEVATLNCYCLFTVSFPTQQLGLKEEAVFYSSLHLQLGDSKV